MSAELVRNFAVDPVVSSSLALVACQVPATGSSAMIAYLVIHTGGSEAVARVLTTAYFCVALLCGLVCLHRMAYSGSYE